MEKRLSLLLLGAFWAAVIWAAAVSAAPAVDKEGVYEVVYPLGEPTTKIVPLAPRLETLAGKTICEVWNGVFSGDKSFPVIEEVLAKKFPAVKVISYDKFGRTHGLGDDKVISSLPGLLKQYKCDAVISGNGG
jgi:hypothetical protein